MKIAVRRSGRVRQDAERRASQIVRSSASGVLIVESLTLTGSHERHRKYDHSRRRCHRTHGSACGFPSTGTRRSAS